MNIRAQIKALYQQASDKLAEIADAADSDAIKAIVDEAAALKARADEMKKALELQSELREPVLPAALPTSPSQTPTDDDSETPPAIKAVYVTRFGDENSAIKTILRDLHGEDYEQQRWEHLKTFNHWLRDYTNPVLPPEGRKFLWTPATIKTALLDGVDVAAMKTTMVEAASQLGGYIVPEDWRATIIEKLAQTAVIRSRATVATTSRDVYEQPKATGGDDQYTSSVRVTWVDETPEAGTAATNLTWGMEKIPVSTVMAETFFSRSQVEDAAFNLPAYLADKLAEAAAIDEDNRFLTGDGQGAPWGILPGNANALSLGEVESEGVGAVSWDDLIDLFYKLLARYRNNAVWIAENQTYAAIAKLEAGTDGQKYWKDQYGRYVGETPRPQLLMGKPALEQEVLPTIANGAYPLIFGDIRGYTVVDRVGMSIERYLDSQTARQDMVCYLMRRRLGGRVMEPWRFAALKIKSS